MTQPGNYHWNKLRRNPAYIFHLMKVMLFRRRTPSGPAQAVIVMDRAPEPVHKPAVPDPQPLPAEAIFPDIQADPAKLNLACIMDEFTRSCFRPEFNMLSPTPVNWPMALENYRVDALFVESAWHGNDDSWQYKVGKYNEKNLQPMLELLDACRNRGIPTLFWNKEDPVHFDKFIDPACRFNYIFTTDADCIPAYRERAGHDKVFALPFAAQEKEHNPVREAARDGQVCFAGTYHAKRYADRRDDMEVILKPALEFGLDIFDRMHGADPKYAENYRFPDIYQPAIKGRLEYADMVKAYRKYKVFLNVNSVRNSPTMFARRVFELLACGTPVISTYSQGIIGILGPDTVLITESEEETKSYLEKLLGDEIAWWRQSLLGMRKVLEHHTYSHRTKDIFEQTGLPFRDQPPVEFKVYLPFHSPEADEPLISCLEQQHYRHFSVILVTRAEGPMPEAAGIAELEARLHGVPVMVQAENELGSEPVSGDYAAFFLPGNWYGKNYLRDYAIAAGYSTMPVLGKKSHFLAHDSGQLLIREPGLDFMPADEVMAASVVMNRTVFNPREYMKITTNKWYSNAPGMILSIDPFNFLPGIPVPADSTIIDISL